MKKMRSLAVAAALASLCPLAAAQTEPPPAVPATPSAPVPAPVPEPATDQQPGSPVVRAIGSELKRYLSDGRVIFTAPLSWDAKSWATAGGVVATVAILATQDTKISNTLSHDQSSGTQTAVNAVTNLGSSYAVGLSAASLGAGLVFHDPRLRDLGRDALEAELFAGGIITPVIKRVVGRERPISGGDGDEAHPFSNNQSFPSGHTTNAFALASVIAARSEGWVVPTIAYTLASAVGLARIHDHQHYASDVVAGAAIGTAVGRTVVKLNGGGSERRAGLTFVPVPVVGTDGGAGIGFRLVPREPRRPPEIIEPAVLEVSAHASYGGND